MDFSVYLYKFRELETLKRNLLFFRYKILLGERALTGDIHFTHSLGTYFYIDQSSVFCFKATHCY